MAPGATGFAVDPDLARTRQPRDAHGERVLIRIGGRRDRQQGRPGVVAHFQRRDGGDLRRPVGRAWIEIERLRAERTEDVGLLLVVGRLQHAVPHAAEEQTELQTGRLQVLEQGIGERAMAATAILGRLIRLGGHCHQRVPRHGVDPRQPRRGGPSARGGDAPRQPIDERIVATGIQQDDAQPLGLRGFVQKKLQRQRLIDQVAFALEQCVGGQQVIFAPDLHAVTRIVDDGHIRLLSLDSECPQ